VGKVMWRLREENNKGGGYRPQILGGNQNIENMKRRIERQNTIKMKKVQNVEESYLLDVGNFLPDYTETR
jgi:hypothetical protein